MNCSGQDFRWMKVKNGKLHLAVVNLHTQKNDTRTEIIEDYSGYKYSKDLIDVRHEGFNIWKIGLKNGLEFALSNSSDFWTIRINGICGSYLDTNAAIVGYTGILAFLEQTKVTIDEQVLQQLKEFVYNSWKDNNSEKQPNFNDRIFE